MRDCLEAFIINNVMPGDKLGSEFVEVYGNFIEEQIQKLAYEDPAVTKKMNEVAYARACEIFFGEYFKRKNEPAESFKVLMDTGKLYCPPNGTHSWEANLNWLSERFRSGAEFVLMSIVCNESKLRSSGLTGSGYFREIATCWKQGYRFAKIGNETLLKDPNVEELKHIKKENVMISDSELEDLHQTAVKEFNKLHPVITTAGITQSKLMDKLGSDKLLMDLINNGVDREVIRVIHSIGQNNSYYIEVKSPNLADLKVAQDLMGNLSENPDSAKIKKEVYNSNFLAVIISASELPKMNITKDCYGRVMITRFDLERSDTKEKQ